MRRHDGHSYVGRCRYLLTFCTFGRRRFFEAGPIVETVVLQILRAGADSEFAITTYCCMPDHMHLLVEGMADDASLIGFVRRSKQMSGYHAGRLVSSSTANPAAPACDHRFWQTGYHDRVLRAHEETRAFIAYIVNKPIRAGLVESAADYPFTGSGVYTREQLWDYIAIP